MKKVLIAILWVVTLWVAYLRGNMSGWDQGKIAGRTEQLCWSSNGLIGLAEQVRSKKQPPPLKVIEQAIESSIVDLVGRPEVDASLSSRVLNHLYQYQKRFPDASFSKDLERKVSAWYYNQSDAGKKNPIVNKK